MIEHLVIRNCFTHRNSFFDFKPGLTGIVGPNESGKSLVVEMIRYALFGSRALRGKASDYKDLHVEMTFRVLDRSYRVLRSPKKTELVGIASGTRPVDEAIIRLLGYDLTVFDVANACNQGQVEALSDMAPSARKAMVDRTVGLDQLDELILHCGQQGNLLRKEAQGILSALTEPQPPEGDHRPSNEVQADLEQAAKDLAEWNRLKGLLSAAPVEPTPPGPPPVPETAEDLRVYQENRRAVLSSIEYLTRQLQGIEPERMTEEEIQRGLRHLEDWDRWQQKCRLLAQGEHTCPACNHRWPVADLSGLEDVVEVDPPVVSMRELRLHESRLGNDRQRRELQVRIEAIVVPPDRAQDLGRRQAYETALAIHDQQRAAYDAYNRDLPIWKARFEALKGIEKRHRDLSRELIESTAFEQKQRDYEATLIRYRELRDRAQALSDKASDYLEARSRMQALKLKMKSFLLPSLNRVASLLLSQMTGGSRSEILVDEDFQILVDGQPISTLSGSGKAVSNLAVRIALGQILTNRTFSVFLADEVDAAMDDERAAHTAEALRRLTRLVSQVILVTHKKPDTDHLIELIK